MPQIDNPIFQSVEQALHFSFLVEGSAATGKSQMQVLFESIRCQRGEPQPAQSKSTIDFGGISPLEIKAQCALVRGIVKKNLEGLALHVIYARYANQPENSKSIRTIRDEIADHIKTNGEKQTLAIAWRAVARKEYLTGITNKSIAKEYGLTEHGVRRDVKRIKNFANSLEVRAIAVLLPIFERGGLIPID